MRKLVILRGVSGSGKSTKARQMIADFYKETNSISWLICSADDYFMNNGVYKFDRRLLKEAHLQCQIDLICGMMDNVELIILDNTNTHKWEYASYLGNAKQYGYEVEEVIVGNTQDVELYAARNKHGVPLESIARQSARFEK